MTPAFRLKRQPDIAPEAAASAVRSHEQEHVSREQSKAQQEGREVVSQSVTIHTAICPECGRVYVSGGTTRTTTRQEKAAQMYQQQEQAPSQLQSVGIRENSRSGNRLFFAVCWCLDMKSHPFGWLFRVIAG